MKRKIPVLIGILCVLSIAVGAYAATKAIEINAQLRPDFVIEIDEEVREFYNVNGERVYPVLYEGTTYLPVRAIGEMMNKKVYWFEEEKRIELRDNKTTVTDADVIITDTETGKDKNKDEKPKADASDFIAPNMAKKVALQKAGLAESEVITEKVELDKENGVWVYEVEFSKGYTEYDVYVDATDGTILKYRTDTDD